MRIFKTHSQKMRLDDGRVLPTFITQALRGESFSVVGDGNETRSTYVIDAIEALNKNLTSDQSEHFNIGNLEELSVTDFAPKIATLAGIRLHVINKPLPENDPKVRRPDISKTRELL